MKKFGLIMIAAFALITLPAVGAHMPTHHPVSTPMGGMSMDDMNMDSMDMGNVKKVPSSGHGMGVTGHMGGHAHSSWETPPEAYSQQQFDGWSDYTPASEGMSIYQAQCMSCHGVDGRGTGPLAQSLEHPPADLTNHFHKAPGKGDAYLFWRVSEGGQVEPFKSAQSMMPSFKQTLSEDQRWKVLSYVHQAFHRGFKPDQPMPEGMDHKSMGHH